MIGANVRRNWKYAAAAAGVLWAAGALAQWQGPDNVPSRVRPAILSTSRPTDSLGETVYEMAKPAQRDASPVAGVFTIPVPLDTPVPEYPDSMRRAKQNGHVVIEGVVTKDGRFIDGKSVTATDQGFVQSAIDATSRYTFRPATLDGKPVACLLRVEVNYTIFSGPRRP